MTQEQCDAALAECRQQIDDIDQEIVRWLNRRAEVVEVIGSIKQKAAMKVYEPKREELVYANVTRNNRGPLSDGGLKRVYERIMDEMRTLQRDRMAARAAAGPPLGSGQTGGQSA